MRHKAPCADRFLAAVRAAEPKGLTAREAVERVYADADGGPDWGLGCIYVMANRLRKRRKIVSVGNNREARYRLADVNHALTIPADGGLRHRLTGAIFRG